MKEWRGPSASFPRRRLAGWTLHRRTHVDIGHSMRQGRADIFNNIGGIIRIKGFLSASTASINGPSCLAQTTDQDRTTHYCENYCFPVINSVFYSRQPDLLRSTHPIQPLTHPSRTPLSAYLTATIHLIGILWSQRSVAEQS